MKRLALKTCVAALAFSLAAFSSACGETSPDLSAEDDADPKFGDEDDSGRPHEESDGADADASAGESDTQASVSDGGDSGEGGTAADSSGGDGDSAADGSSGDGDAASDGSAGDGDSGSDTGDGSSGSDPSASDTGTDSGSDASTSGGNPDCFGPTELPSSNDPWEQPADPHAIGSTWPYWQAEDFQPLSCLYGETYGPNAFLGTVTVFINWRATCSYCQAQAAKFEELRIELKLMGHEVYFVGLNQVGYDDPAQQVLLSDLTSFNLMQGTSEYDLWGLGQAAKDAIFIYDVTGHLVQYIEPLGEISTNMNTTEGYDNVKNAVLAALGG